jgi:hypothetical protein
MVKDKLIRPPVIEEGEYWIGRFMVSVKEDTICISPRQLWSHNHQDVDTMVVRYLDKENCRINLKRGDDTDEAEGRIVKLIRSKEWRPRRYKSR